jgi:plasmid stabilization system protein ParE
VDPISDPSGEGLAKVVEGLKRAWRLEVDVDVEISEEPFVLGRTVHEGDGYRIYLSEPEPYPLLHEFYHVLFEEKVMKRQIGQGCEFCGKIVFEMMNVLVDLAIERIICRTDREIFPAYFPRAMENLERIARCGALSFDPARTVAYNLYLETVIRELYPEMRADYDFWERIDLSDGLREGVDSALEIAAVFVRERPSTWREISRAAVDLSWPIFGADVMVIESREEYGIVCNTDHIEARRNVSEMIDSLKSSSRDWRKREDAAGRRIS